MLRFEVFRKRGRGWQYLGEWEATDSKKAGRLASHYRRVRTVGVRPAGSSAEMFVYRFKLMPLGAG